MHKLICTLVLVGMLGACSSNPQTPSTAGKTGEVYIEMIEAKPEAIAKMKEVCGLQKYRITSVESKFGAGFVHEGTPYVGTHAVIKFRCVDE